MLLAAFAALVHRRTRGEDLVIGTPVTTRSRPELDTLIGYFVTMLPLRLNVGAGLAFRDLVRHVRDTSFDAHAHRDTPLDSIVNAVLDDRRLDVSPLFQTAFELHPGSGSAVRLGDLSGTRRLHAHQVAKFEQVWMIEDPGTALRGWIEFDERLYDRATVAGFCREWIESLSRYTEDPAARVGEPPPPPARWSSSSRSGCGPAPRPWRWCARGGRVVVPGAERAGEPGGLVAAGPRGGGG